jgi:hypothetical protein
VTPLTALEGGDLLADLPGWPVPIRLRTIVSTPPQLVSVLDGAVLSRNSAPEPGPADALAGARRDAAQFDASYVLGDGTGPATKPARLELADGRLWLASPQLTGLSRLRLDPDESGPGLYFSATGEALDLRADPPRYASIPLTRET